MNREEHLMVRAMEECNEIAHRLSKILIFGREDVQPNQSQTNQQRLNVEVHDLLALLEMLDLFRVVEDVDQDLILAKRMKVERYLLHSASQGRLR